MSSVDGGSIVTIEPFVVKMNLQFQPTPALAAVGRLIEKAPPLESIVNTLPESDGSNVLAAGAAGDNCELICDGSNFYVSGTAHANDHMSIA